MRENSVFRCCSSTGWDTPIIPQLAPHKRWTVMDSQCHTLQCVWSFFFSSSQDASVTQATSRVNDNVGDYNPFSSPEMVSLCVFNGTAHIIVWYDIQQEPNPLVLWKYIWKEILLQPFFTGTALWDDNPYLCCTLSTSCTTDICGAEPKSEWDECISACLNNEIRQH